MSSRQIGPLAHRDNSAILTIEASLALEHASVWLARLDHARPDEHIFDRGPIYWIELCLTPRRPQARARYIDRWGPHRFGALGSTIMLPPNFKLQLISEGGQHLSLICALKASAVDRWLGEAFEWNDRRLEACLNTSSPPIRSLMLRLAHEMRHPGIATRELSDSIVFEMSIEIARHLIAIDEPTEMGGLASWRLRIIDRRLDQPTKPPTLLELAQLCSISHRQLTRGFRTSRGCSIGTYIALHRIDAAKRRLATDERIKSIAAATGFSSQSAFTYSFRRATGVTPREFRERVLRGMKR